MKSIRFWNAASSLLAAAALLMSAGAGWSQTAGAGLSGRVVDESQAAVVGAIVDVVRSDTGFTRQVLTDSEGAFRFANLPVGAYDVKVSAAGFGPLEQKGLVLNVATNRTLELVLPVAGVEEKLTVTADVLVVR